MSDIVIKLTNVSKYYKLYDAPADRLKEALNPFGKKYHKQYYALKDVNLSVKRGELLGIVGKNGCGKSTLLKIISSVLVPDSGSVEVNGRVSALLELGSGFNPEFSGLQNIYFYAMILGLKREKVDSIIDEIVEFADLGEYINQPVKSYSSGMKARLGFSVATAIKPEILILDEVLAVGDAQFRKKSSARMQELMSSGCTVLLVSHSEDSINRLCSRAVYLRDGEVVVSGTPRNVTKIYLMTTRLNQYVSSSEIRSEFQILEKGNTAIDNSERGVSEYLFDEDSFYSKDISDMSRPVITQNFPVELLSAEILSRDNKKVNVLEHANAYKFVFKFLFTKGVDNAVIPINIYSSVGQMLFGVRNPGSGNRLNVDPGSVVTATFDFECSFLSGVMHLSVGVTQLVGVVEDKNILLRVDDALSFKVQESKQDEKWGMFSPVINNISHEIIHE